MQPKLLDFRYKGDRDYIHGTDIFNALIGLHSPAAISKVRFTIHGFVRTPRCEVYRADSREALSTLQDIKVRASFDLSGVTQWVALRESSSPGPVGRYEYTEDRITALCTIQDHGVALRRESNFTFIETVVAMNKYMHAKLFADADGKWIFTGIDLGHGCDAGTGISLKIGRDVNYRLTRAEIMHNGHAFGNIFFSLLR